MRNLAREPRTYELLTILSPDVPEEEIPGALERISGHVTGVGGSIQETLRDSPWGRRRLAYPIRHAGRDVRDGFYTLFHVSLAPDRVDDMERELKLNTQVIRYLVTSYAPKPLDPRAIEDAEIAAEDAAAAAYAAAQAEASRLATANAAAEATEAGATGAAAATETPPVQTVEPPAATEVATPEDTPAAAAAPDATEPPLADRADVGGDQPIQGAGGLAGQPVDQAAGEAAGAPSAGVVRADQEAEDAGTGVPAESGTPTEET